MEDNLRRRLNCLVRHLLFPAPPYQLVWPSTVSSEQLKISGSTPVVIGGMVLDIHAKPSTSVKYGTTTPGKVTWTSGGVARNIAECMSKLGAKPFIISVVGLDIPGEYLLSCWRSSGLTTEGIWKHPDIETPVISSMFDFDGELTAGVAGVQAVEKMLTPEWIFQFRDNIHSASVIMVDANMSPSALEAACQIGADSGIPVWFEPVSVAKSTRVASIAKLITWTSPNQHELIAMANALSSGFEFHPNQRLQNDGRERTLESLVQMLNPAICLLLEKGIKVVVVTLGSDGVLLCSGEGPQIMKDRMRTTGARDCSSQLYEIVSATCPPNGFCSAGNFQAGSSHPYIVHFPAVPASVVSVTGAGDCLVSGVLASLCAGLDIMQSLAVGIAVAKEAVETSGNVPARFCLRRISENAKQVYFSAKEVTF